MTLPCDFGGAAGVGAAVGRIGGEVTTGVGAGFKVAGTAVGAAV